MKSVVLVLRSKEEVDFNFGGRIVEVKEETVLLSLFLVNFTCVVVKGNCHWKIFNGIELFRRYFRWEGISP